jgi:nicotinate phosphoribosyltransferase
MLYQPSKILYEGIQHFYPVETCPWDDYFPRMAQTDYFSKRHNLQATKTFFIRKNPFEGSYTVMGGLTIFLYLLEKYTFNEIVGKALLDMGYNKEFIDYLKFHNKIKINIYAIPEGKLFFPHEPAIIMEGSLLDIRFAEGLLCKYINYPSLSFTKWSRVVQIAAPGALMEFSRRRAQNDITTSIYAQLAGAKYTSNAEIRSALDVKVVGTMGHEFIQSIGDEFEAFDLWLKHNPDKPVLLGDTIDLIKSGLPNAIKAFKKHIRQIKTAEGIPGFRIDLARSNIITHYIYKCVNTFKKEGLPFVTIYLTGDLDEYRIADIKGEIKKYEKEKKIKTIDSIMDRIVWACGTNPGTCNDQPSLGGVAKLTTIEKNEKIRNTIKVSRDDILKTSIGGNNRSIWVFNKLKNAYLYYLIYSYDENLEDITKGFSLNLVLPMEVGFLSENISFTKRQELVYEGKEKMPDTDYSWKKDTIEDIQDRHKTDLRSFGEALDGIFNPASFNVLLSEKVYKTWIKMIKERDLIDNDEH